ncbi:RHS repeat domain-containing protein [Pseudomonas sp. NPDC089743]|uniref:RHS repeat domain-containing protein n=1 Tax=Pseudomonas sp. NPDC089743 TaxID=3364471 RepID=UPI003809B60D
MHRPFGDCWQEETVAGQLLKSIDPLGGEWRYSYDDIGRLIETRDPSAAANTSNTCDTGHWRSGSPIQPDALSNMATTNTT